VEYPEERKDLNPAPSLEQVEKELAVSKDDENWIVDDAVQPEASDSANPEAEQFSFDPAASASASPQTEQFSANPTTTADLNDFSADPVNGSETNELSIGSPITLEAGHPSSPASTETTAPSQTSPTEGGIEILVQMAEKGEIDPKNIDIIDTTDRFLAAIAAAPKENLRQSGKILFHASVLLRMKAEALLAISNDDDAFALDDFMEFDENGSPIIYDSRSEPVARQITLQDLERALVRRSHSKQFRQRRVTLEQLIEALREAERIESVRSQKKQAPKIDLEGQHEINDVGDILDLAHDEDIEDVIQKIEAILSNFLDTSDLIPLLELIRLLDKGGDWVDAFLAVLFLSNAGKITLEQEEFYGPLYIVRAEQQPAAPQPVATI
jgi:segregation and condensation protein A